MKFKVLDFAGLCWPSLAFYGLCGLACFLRKNWPLLIKIKHNWPVSDSQMSKSIAEGARTF